MKSQLFQADIVVRKSPIQGYGVFARQEFKKGDLIEECKVLVTDDPKVFNNYVFSGGEKHALMALGYGSLYNHAAAPNAIFDYYPDRELLVFTAKKSIKSGEEILIHYGKNWFSCRELQVKFPLRYKLRKIFTKTVWRFSLVMGFILCLVTVLGTR